VNTYVISDTHWNEGEDGCVLDTYCQRPHDYTAKTIRNWNQTVQPEDLVIHCGDVINGDKKRIKKILDSLNGRKVLVTGNHDRNHGEQWWMRNGFDFACQGFKFRNVWFTHEPAGHLPEGCLYNVHGHLHNIWDGFHSPERIERDKELLGVDFTKQLKYPWQRLFALEYCGYRPINIDKFLAHPERFKATGPGSEIITDLRPNPGPIQLADSYMMQQEFPRSR
jgi:calcineurin-like phosphoesterase family protein